jgi:hypothetical protein
MTTPRDPDARIAAFFETSQPDLPDRTFDRVRSEIHRTRQLVVIGPVREPDSLGGTRSLLAAAAVVAIAVVLLNVRPVVGPGGLPAPPPTPTVVPSPVISPSPSASASPSASPSGPTTFTSPLYRYTATVPAGWVATPALLRWDGVNEPGPYAESDVFAGPARLTAWAISGPFDGDLAAFVADRIAATHRDHADTCPVADPEINEPFQVSGQAWVLLGWDCGALINEAVTVRSGVAFEFVFRDLAVQAATDPTDRALFRSILDSVELPD